MAMYHFGKYPDTDPYRSMLDYIYGSKRPESWIILRRGLNCEEILNILGLSNLDK